MPAKKFPLKSIQFQAGTWQVDITIQDPGIKAVISGPVGNCDNARDVFLLIALCRTFYTQHIFACNKGICDFCCPLGLRECGHGCPECYILKSSRNSDAGSTQVTSK